MTDPTSPARKAVVLAAGRGSRMAASSAAMPPLDPGQQVAADRGLKVLMPFHGHPFLSHVLSVLADGGIEDVCLVVGPGDDPVRRHYLAHPARRLRLTFAVQEQPRGSGHALLAAAAYAAGDPVLMVNGDNLYPPSVVDEVRRLPGDGLAGFRASALSRAGGIPREHVAAFALVSVRADGCLDQLAEKPTAADAAAFGADPLVSMNCWRFTPPIFAACAGLKPSPRGECELTDAVRQRVRDGACFRVLPVEAPVLDLTRRSDIPHVEAWLSRQHFRL
jgi:dTDP-glucose pyrophosphorylase